MSFRGGGRGGFSGRGGGFGGRGGKKLSQLKTDMFLIRAK
jgi:hypothetical protein